MPAAEKVEAKRVELLGGAPLNSWVALSADETHIVAIGNTFVEANETAKNSGERNYVLVRTPDAWVSRVFPVVH
jgi:hypothetical protein